MMPGGHLATSIGLSAAAYAATGSAAAAAGCLWGGFLIDVDHYWDYLFFERQWRRPGPRQFLRYYFTYQPKRLVLPLHSLELMALLGLYLLFAATGPLLALLAGYWAGAAMHLIFDILINGDHVLNRRVLFYSFVYRARNGFAAERMLRPATVSPDAAAHPIRDFFVKWLPNKVDDPPAHPFPQDQGRADER